MAAELVQVVDAQPDAKPPEKADAKFTAVDDSDKLKASFTFHAAIFVPENGKTYAGQFKARRLGLGSIGQAKVHEARLNGGQLLPEPIYVLHEMLAYCFYALVEVPDWWKPSEFLEEEIPVLKAVNDHVRHWESSFRKGGVG